MYLRQYYPHIKIFQQFSLNSSYLDSLYPSFNTPKIKDKRVLSFVQKQQYRLYIITFSINISVFFSYTKNASLQTCISFWKGNSTTWDGQIPLWKCSSPINLNLFNSVSSKEFLSMITSAFTVDWNYIYKKKNG